LAEVDGRVEVRTGEATEVQARMASEGSMADPITVTRVMRRVALPGMEDVERRYHNGRGRFVLEEEIQVKNPDQLSEMLTGTGVEVRAEGDGGLVMPGPGCAPDVYLDGVRLTRSPNPAEGRRGGEPEEAAFRPFPGGSHSPEKAAEAAVNLVHPLSVLAVEVYGDPDGTPGQYLDSDQPCGVILIWTRRGNVSGGQ
jgi:hypothetical protein